MKMEYVRAWMNRARTHPFSFSDFWLSLVYLEADFVVRLKTTIVTLPSLNVPQKAS